MCPFLTVFIGPDMQNFKISRNKTKQANVASLVTKSFKYDAYRGEYKFFPL